MVFLFLKNDLLRRTSKIVLVLIAILMIIGISSNCFAATKKEEYTMNLRYRTNGVKKGMSMKVELIIRGDTKNVRNKTVKWKTSNKKIATVSNGIIRGIKPGRAVVSAQLGKVTAKMNVLVFDYRIVISKKNATLFRGQELQLDGRLESVNGPDEIKIIEGDNYRIIWSSSNKKIATVDENGLVHAKKPGKVTITAKAGGFGPGWFKNEKCVITVR